MSLVLDTGILYAAADADDAWHQRAATLLGAERRGTLVVPITILPEVCYLLHDRLGSHAERVFLSTLGRQLAIEQLQPIDLDLARQLLDQHPAIGFVDASVAAIAARLRIPRVATTDRRHFAAIRLPSGVALELLP